MGGVLQSGKQGLRKHRPIMMFARYMFNTPQSRVQISLLQKSYTEPPPYISFQFSLRIPPLGPSGVPSDTFLNRLGIPKSISMPQHHISVESIRLFLKCLLQHLKPQACNTSSLCLVSAHFIHIAVAQLVKQASWSCLGLDVSRFVAGPRMFDFRRTPHFVIVVE